MYAHTDLDSYPFCPILFTSYKSLIKMQLEYTNAIGNNTVVFMCFPAGLTYLSFFHVIEFFSSGVVPYNKTHCTTSAQNFIDV